MVPLVSLCLGATSRDVTRGVPMPSRRVDSNLGRHIRVKSASPMLEGLEADLSCRNWVEAAVSQQQVRWEMCVHDKRHDKHVTGQITARAAAGNSRLLLRAFGWTRSSRCRATARC